MVSSYGRFVPTAFRAAASARALPTALLHVLLLILRVMLLHCALLRALLPLTGCPLHALLARCVLLPHVAAACWPPAARDR
ncbi:unnamed protein product [Closterium sp. NIES-53]